MQEKVNLNVPRETFNQVGAVAKRNEARHGRDNNVSSNEHVHSRPYSNEQINKKRHSIKSILCFVLIGVFALTTPKPITVYAAPLVDDLRGDTGSAFAQPITTYVAPLVDSFRPFDGGVTGICSPSNLYSGNGDFPIAFPNDSFHFEGEQFKYEIPSTGTYTVQFDITNFFSGCLEGRYYQFNLAGRITDTFANGWANVEGNYYYRYPTNFTITESGKVNPNSTAQTNIDLSGRGNITTGLTDGDIQFPTYVTGKVAVVINDVWMTNSSGARLNNSPQYGFTWGGFQYNASWGNSATYHMTFTVTSLAGSQGVVYFGGDITNFYDIEYRNYFQSIHNVEQSVDDLATQEQQHFEQEVNQAQQGVSDVSSSISEMQSLETKWSILWYPITFTTNLLDIFKNGSSSSAFYTRAGRISGYKYDPDTGTLYPVYSRARDTGGGAVIKFPAYTLPILDVQLWEEFEYDLSTLRTDFPELFAATDTAIVIIELLWVVAFLRTKYYQVFTNGGDE